MPSARYGAAESITRAIASGNAPDVLVRTVTGFEGLAAEELTSANHRVIELSKRQVIVQPANASIVTEPPRLADDSFIIVSTAPDPGRGKPALVDVTSSLRARFDVKSAATSRQNFAVTASFVGRRNYNRFDIEDRVGALIADRTGGRYHSRRDGGVPPARRVDWRVTLDGSHIRVGMRPFQAPLHRRSWRQATVVGSLHPPVAAAMARLARISAHHHVVDPCCGAGTLLLEAREIEPRARYLGIDQDEHAVAAARANDALGEVTWQMGDAAALDVPAGTVDRVVTNPPWDVRLGIGDITPHLRDWHRVLRPSGLLVALLNQHQAVQLSASPRWHVRDSLELSVAGQHPRLLVAEQRDDLQWRGGRGRTAKAMP